MKKGILLGIGLSLCLSFTAYAGEWKQDANGWRWQNDDGTSPLNGWQWLDGNQDGISECYYFDSDGYMLADTTTPDNYQVNKDGAWIVNGEIQRQSVSNEATNESDVFIDLVPWFTTDLQYFDSAIKLTPEEEGWKHFDWRTFMNDPTIQRYVDGKKEGFEVCYDYKSSDTHIKAIYGYPNELMKGLTKERYSPDDVEEVARLAEAGGAEVELKYTTEYHRLMNLNGGGWDEPRELERVDLTVKYNGLIYKLKVGGLSWNSIMTVTKE